ncbi:hypothetical protein PESHB5_19200 [Pediococcus parvulus]
MTYKVHQGNKSFVVLSDSIVNIDHGWTVPHILQELDKLNNFANYVDDIIEVVNQIHFSKNLKDEQLFEIFGSSSHVQNEILPQKVKEEIEKFKNGTEVATNTVNVLDLFSKLQSITEKTSVDALIYMESKFDKFVKSKLLS